MRDAETILVVDDMPALLESIQLTLTFEAYRVLVAHDGLEALEQLQQEPVDLVLADIAMPRMNGYQLYERMRDNPAWAHIPFLFLTARAMDSDVRYGKELGVDDYLVKPIEPEDLLATVHGKLRRSRQLLDAATHLAEAAATTTCELSVGSLYMETDKYRAWWHKEPLELSAREFSLLACLAQRAEQVVSTSDLVQVTHDLNTDPTEAGSLVRPLVRSVRRKLGIAKGENGCIETVRGVGYRLTAQPT